MTGASYIPGGWLGIVRSRTAVLLGPEAPAELAGALWELLAGRPEPHEVLAAVTSSSGGSLIRIPSFAILDFNGSLRVFLRGDVDLTVEQPGGAVDLDGRDVTTWNERKFVMPGTCTLGIADGGAAGAGVPQHSARPELPLGEGVVLLRSLTFEAPSGQAAVDGPVNRAAVGEGPTAANDKDAARSPSAPDGPFAVNAAGEVDGVSEADGIGDLSHGAGTVVGVIDEDLNMDPAADSKEDPAADLKEDPAADLNDLEADLDGERAEDANLPQAFAADVLDPEGLDPSGLDPDATIAPGAIIDADEELLEEPADPGPVGDGPAGPESGPGDAAPAEEQTSSYDHLWDRTVMRNIEDAAVREEPEADSGHVVPQQPPALPAAEPLAALGAAEDAGPQLPAAGSGPAGEPRVGTGADDPAAVGLDTAAAPPTPRPASTGLIDSVPWRTGGAASTPAPAIPEPAPLPTLGTPPAPAVQPPVPFDGGPAGATQGPPRTQPEAGFDPDHDGQTVMKNSLPGAGPGLPANLSAAQQDAGDGPLVLARVCSQGHANPPTRAQCSACGAALLPDAVQVARPRLGRMRLSTGELLDLDQSMVIGRQPSVSRVQGGVMPRLVQVASPGGDISRSHVEVRLEGWHVMLCDLKATNGTVLVREGQPPRRLAQNEMAILLDGDIADLGDNISLRFEEIP